MKCLDISREEAIQVIADDEKIDKGEKLFEQTAEQKKASKKACYCAKAVNAYGKSVTRERKADNTKQEIINILVNSLKDIACNLEITNAERELNFIVNDRKFKIVLSAPRK